MLAGAPGFEPGNGGTKNRCLTTWRRPNARVPTRFATASQLSTMQVETVLECYRRCRYNAGHSAVVRRGIPNVRQTRRPEDYRSIAQPGSAPASGAGGRVFESLYSDQQAPASREVGVFRTDRVAGSATLSTCFRALPIFAAAPRRRSGWWCPWTLPDGKLARAGSFSSLISPFWNLAAPCAFKDLRGPS